MLSQVLLKSIENEEDRREREIYNQGLHRSLSLPRRSIHQLSSLHPFSTAGDSKKQSTIDTFSNTSDSLSSSNPRPSDAQSIDSMHDSLLDLADDLGGEEVCHHRSNSNPEMLFHSTVISTSQSCEGLDSRQSPDSHVTRSEDDQLQSEKKKKRKLLQNWVREQKKK